MSEELAETLICCDTAPELRGPGTDHVPIHTIIDTEIATVTPEPYRDFRTVDWKAFREHLAQQLMQLPRPQTLRNDMQFHSAVTGLTEAIQATTAAIVPLAKPSPHSRCRWSQELSALKKKLNRLNNQSYKFRALADHPIHTEHRGTQ